MITKNTLRILFVEDLPSDVELAVLELRKEKLKFEHTTVCTRVDLLKALEEFRPDLIISDYMMPTYNGLQALRDVKEFDESIPFILYTGSINEETAVECLKSGADDYVIKKHMTKLPFAVKEVLEQLIIIKEKRAAEQLLKESEERFRTLYNDAVVGLYRTTPRGEILLANHALVRMLGFSSFEELAARNLKSGGFGPSYSRQEFVNRIEKDGMVKDLESSWIDCDGKEIFVRESAKVIYGTDKKILCYDGTVQDITEQKRAAEALNEIQHLFKTLALVSPVGIFRTDQDGCTTYVNPKYSELTGLSLEEAMGKGWFNAVHPDDKEILKGSWLSDFKSRKISIAEYRFLKPDGTVVWVMGNAVPELIDNKIVGYIGTITDITHLKQTERELLKHHDHLEELVDERTEELHIAKKEAEDANKAKSEFLANMSHEIRTPMNAVLGYTELLSSTIVDQTQKDYINSIKSSGRSLLTLIDDILDLSKIEAGKLELDYDNVDTYSFFSEFERIFSLKVFEKGLKFILDITSGTPAGIYIDEARVRQIVFNLLGNAIKFTSDGKIILKVFTENPQIVNYSKEKSEELIDLIIKVQDTGIGISKELQEAIFEPFVQERNYKHYGGTGLGLAITRRLTALMNGTINLKSEPGKGSTFTVRIPEITYLRDFSKTTEEIQIDPAEIVFEKAAILIADDVEHNRRYLRDALKNTNLKIVEAEDGVAAYKLAKEIVPDLIIADIRMPKMDGFQLLNKIKSNKKLKHIPVIAYSASVLRAQKERIHKSEFVGLLIKPVKVTELYLALMNILQYKSTRKAEHDKPLSEVDSIGEITGLPGLIQSLETGFYATWKTFNVRQPIGEIRDFGKNLIQLGLDHNSSIITGYGKDLISAADSFNIEAILKLIGKYTGIIESLKNSIRNISNG